MRNCFYEDGDFIINFYEITHIFKYGTDRIMIYFTSGEKIEMDYKDPIKNFLDKYKQFILYRGKNAT